MALNALTLSASTGAQSFPFMATVIGRTAGANISIVHADSSPGFTLVNSLVYSLSLPFVVSTVAIRERNPATGEISESRIDIFATPFNGYYQGGVFVYPSLPVVPANAILGEDGTPLLTEDGQYILTE